MGKPEGKVESYLIELAKTMGFECYKFTSPGNRGVPDRILIGHGYTFFVETKAENEEPRLSQKIVINTIIERGGLVYVVDSKEQVLKLITAFVNKKPPKPKKQKIPNRADLTIKTGIKTT